MKKGQIRIKPKHRDEIDLDQIVTALFLHSVHGEAPVERFKPGTRSPSAKSANACGGDGEDE